MGGGLKLRSWDYLEEHKHCFTLCYSVKAFSGTLVGPAFHDRVTGLGGLPHKDEFFPICFARGVPDEQIVRAVRETRPFRTGIHTARQIEDLRVGDDCSMELAEGTYTQCFMEAPQALHLTAPDTSVVHVRSVTALTEGVTIQERETRMREKSHQPHNVSVGVNVTERACACSYYSS